MCMYIVILINVYVYEWKRKKPNFPSPLNVHVVVYMRVLCVFAYTLMLHMFELKSAEKV